MIAIVLIAIGILTKIKKDWLTSVRITYSYFRAKSKEEWEIILCIDSMVGYAL